ncbi:hypothetical protein lerEdw1_003099 [Lerista edwardsae]|nr:hypothetical protein lerEdw1_003099 [Lerista edwardsae]
MPLLRGALRTEVSAWERAAVLASCALSGLGAGLLVGTHALWPELRTRPRQLLLCLSLADLLSAASYFYGALRDFQAPSWDCVAQGAVSTFANTSSFFWTVAIALDLYCAIVRGSRAGAGLLCGFHVVSWGVPLLITVVAIVLKKIGYDASDVSVGWCWIDLEAEDRVLWMLLAGKMWEILAYVTLPVFYILIKKHINRAVGISRYFLFQIGMILMAAFGLLTFGEPESLPDLGAWRLPSWPTYKQGRICEFEQLLVRPPGNRICPNLQLPLMLAIASHSAFAVGHAALSEYRPILSSSAACPPGTSVADKKLILIPIIFIFLRIWSTIRFVLTLCDSPAVQNPLLVVLHGIGNTFQGGANCIMFVLCTRVVRNKLLSSLCCWQCNERERSLSSPEIHPYRQVPSAKPWEGPECDRARAEFSST